LTRLQLPSAKLMAGRLEIKNLKLVIAKIKLWLWNYFLPDSSCGFKKAGVLRVKSGLSSKYNTGHERFTAHKSLLVLLKPPPVNVH